MPLFEPFIVSIRIIAFSVFFAFIIGLFTALYTYRRKTLTGVIIEFLIYIPLFLPPTVMGFYLLSFMGKNSFWGHIYELLFSKNFIFSPVAAVTAGTLAALPFVFKSVKSSLEMIDLDILTAAALDGADKLQIFFRIQFPLVRKGIVSGVLLAALRAVGEFGITMMVAGNIPGVTQTMPLAIWNSVMGGDLNKANFYALILAAFSMILVLSATVIDKYETLQ